MTVENHTSDHDQHSECHPFASTPHVFLLESLHVSAVTGQPRKYCISRSRLPHSNAARIVCGAASRPGDGGPEAERGSMFATK